MANKIDLATFDEDYFIQVVKALSFNCVLVMILFYDTLDIR